MTSQPHTRPALVVFDLGGVLIRICRSWSEACAAAGLDVRADTASLNASGRRHELSEQHGLGRVESAEFFRRVSLAMNGVYTPEEVQRVHDAWLLGEYPGVAQLIRDIRAAGVVTGILSNTNHAHWVRLAPRGRGREVGGAGTTEFAATDDIDHPHASHLLGLLKPDPEIYRAFERRVGIEPRAGEILFFDDLEENVATARACGWQAELIDHTGNTAGQMRSHLQNRGLAI